MRFTIVGSGGCTDLPRPCCACPICEEARQKGAPYLRRGCSLYLWDIALLVDTPEDIAIALNERRIPSVDHILYSHWDPDHTLGIRVMEQLRLSWPEHYAGKRPAYPLHLHATPEVLADVAAIKNKFGSFLHYYQSMGLVLPHAIKGETTIGEVTIAFVPVGGDGAVTVFAFSAGGKKLVYAPCDCLPFPEDEALHGADVLLMGNTYGVELLKGGYPITHDHPIRKELHSLADALAIRDRMGAKRLIITHLEEDFGLSHDGYQALARGLSDVSFAYDGMEICL